MLRPPPYRGATASGANQRSANCLLCRFKMPESSVLSVAVAQYKEQYPDQQLNVEKVFTEGSVETHASYNQMLTEIMAGRGPDLIFSANCSISSATDWEKLVAAVCLPIWNLL